MRAIAPPSKKPIALFLTLALVSGAGLLAFGVVALGSGVRSLREQLRTTVREQTESAARALRTAIADPAILPRLPPERRFTVANGELVVPSEVGWVHEPPATPLPWLAGEALRRAQRLEFVEDDAPGAAQVLQQALGAVAEPAAQRVLRLALAWSHHRAGDAAARDVVLAELPSLEPGALLLTAASGQAVPDEAAACVRTLDPSRAEALLARLGEHRPDLDLAPLHAAVADARQRREVLRTASLALPQLRAFDVPRCVPAPGGAPGDVVLWFPANDGGAVVAAEVLVHAVTADAPPAVVPFTGADAPDGVVPVVAAAFGLRVPAVDDSAFAALWSSGGAVAALLLVLCLCLALGLLLAFRALRREAAANAARADFLTSVTHELKTPIASLRLLTEMLEQDRVPEAKRREYHALLAGEAVRLGGLIENVLDLGRLERRERGYDKRLVDVGAVLRETAQLLAPLLARDRMRLQLDLDPAPAPALADRGALVQALLNVLDNARKYARDGERIELTSRVAGTDLVVTVRDHGPGVPATEREAVFERFRRGRAQADGHVPGVGLGLHLARTIVTAHGGTLVCEVPADGGRGAVFRFTIPLAPERQAREEAAWASAS